MLKFIDFFFGEGGDKRTPILQKKIVEPENFGKMSEFSYFRVKYPTRMSGLYYLWSSSTPILQLIKCIELKITHFIDPNKSSNLI